MRRPIVLIEIRLYKYPASEGVRVLRLSTRPVSMAGAFYEPRLLSVGEIRRSATDPDGNYTISESSAVINDQDGEIAALLGEGVPTEFWLNREYGVWIISPEAIDDGFTTADIQPVFRGWLSDVQQGDRTIEVQASDVVGSQMSGLNLGKKALTIPFRSLCTNPRPETADMMLSIYIGEFSDNGDGTPGKGLVPAFELCEVDLTDTSTAPTPTYAAAPTITGSVVGITGEEQIAYGATVITPYGESLMSNVVVLNGANIANRNISNYNKIDITFDPGTDPVGNPYKVRVWYGRPDGTIVGWLDESDYGDISLGEAGYLDGAYPWPSPSRDELDSRKEMTPPASSAAIVDDNIFSLMVTNLGYGYEYKGIFLSDLADGVEPRRKKVEAGEHGVTVITSDDAEWPFPNPWVEMNGVKFTGFLLRGPKLNAHRDGSVTAAVNLCGPHISGNVIDQALFQFQHLINEFVVKGNGAGYRNQTYGTLETYADGAPLVMPSAFEAAQNLTKTWMGNAVGYQGNIWVTDPNATWRDVFTGICQSWRLRLTATRFGQMKPFFVPTDLPAAGTGRLISERMEIKRSEPARLAHDEVVNSYLASWFYDHDAGKYRAVRQPFENEESQAQQVPGGVEGVPDVRGLLELEVELPFTNYAATAQDVMERDIIRRKRKSRYLTEVVDIMGIDHEIGEDIRVTDSRGLGVGGDVEAPCIMLEHVINPDSQEVTFGLQDLRSVAE